MYIVAQDEPMISWMVHLESNLVRITFSSVDSVNHNQYIDAYSGDLISQSFLTIISTINIHEFGN
jgi:hypothetical protein